MPPWYPSPMHVPPFIHHPGYTDQSALEPGMPNHLLSEPVVTVPIVELLMTVSGYGLTIVSPRSVTQPATSTAEEQDRPQSAVGLWERCNRRGFWLVSRNHQKLTHSGLAGPLALLTVLRILA